MARHQQAVALVRLAAGAAGSACCDARAPGPGCRRRAVDTRARRGLGRGGEGAGARGGGGSAPRDPARTPRRAMSALRPRARRAPLLFALAAALLPHADRVA